MRAFTLTGLSDHVDFNSGAADSGGTYWVASDLEGWDCPDVKISTTNRIGAPGVFTQTGQPISRTLNVRQAIILAVDEPRRVKARDRLAAILIPMADPDTPGLITVHEPAVGAGTLDRQCSILLGQKFAFADRAPGEGDIGPLVDGGMPVAMPKAYGSTLTIMLMAVDPFRYAAAAGSQAFTAGVAFTILNGGTAPSPPTITLASPSSPVHLTHTDLGRTVVLSGSMPASLTVDLDERTVVDGAGTNRYDLVTSFPDQWWTVLPGTNHLTVTGAAGTVGWRDSWW